MSSSIHKILVCGAGTMGAGIARLAAESGFEVSLFDTDFHALENARVKIYGSVQKHFEKGKLNDKEKEQILSHLKFSDSFKGMEADLIIEAIVEKIEAKVSLFKDLARHFPEGTILATNTSSLSVTEIASVVPDNKRFIGIHFFNPATVMKLVEIAKTAFNDVEVIDTVFNFAKQLNKIPVLVKDSPGFIVNRIARQYYLEAFRLAENQIADYKTIDHLLENAGFRMGPFALTDMIGQDVNYATTQSIYHQFFQEARFRPSSIQAQLVKEGHLGKKSGKGFFEYK
ncbi:MAG: 3-hydroxyacyl-CoA dehydrogenase family protein [Chitinophagaceae bacterium]